MSKEYTQDDLEISPGEVAELIAARPGQVVLVDVREDWELARGVLPGAVHRPLSRFAEFADGWQGDQTCIVYCEHGVRSLDVTVWLLQNKGIHTRSMRGGFAEWHGPVEQPSSGGGSQ